MVKITPELIKEVEGNEAIDFVHFDAEGGHHWNVREGYTLTKRGVKAPNGKIVAGHDQKEIVETLTRAEVLKAKKVKPTTQDESAS